MVSHLQQTLSVSIAQRSDAGVKPQNEDCLGAHVPDSYQLTSKGIVAVIADGVSAAEAGKEAAETCVQGFISDYYSTPDSWSVKQSAQRVLTALNRWLYGRGQHYLDNQKGYVTTLSTLILKSRSAYIFHVGDSRIYRFRNGDLEQITHDHVTRISNEKTYLARAMGIDLMLDIDFQQLELEPGDLFVSTTDGIHDWVDPKHFKAIIAEATDLDLLCEQLVNAGSEANSNDNLSCQAVRIDSLGEENDEEVFRRLSQLSFPPELSTGMRIDGFKIECQLHASQRSQLYLVKEEGTGKQYAMKTPSANFIDDPAYIERFVMEEWIGQRIDSPYVAKVIACEHRTFLYVLMEYIEGPTLEQVLEERGHLEVKQSVALIEQLSKGLRAFHRKETLHQDLRPANIVLQNDKPVIIDFGSVYVAGVDEIISPFSRDIPLGTLDYSAPEYRLNRSRGENSDQFSLAVILYEMLTGKLPFGDNYHKAQAVNEFSRLKYVPAYVHNPHVPLWMDGAIRKALSFTADLRYESLSEFIYDLTHPNAKFLKADLRPLIEKNPLLLWKGISGLLLITQLITLFFL